MNLTDHAPTCKAMLSKISNAIVITFDNGVCMIIPGYYATVDEGPAVYSDKSDLKCALLIRHHLTFN